MTNPLGDFIAAHDNYKHCFGIIGSGNRNFNEQYCLTAKQYAKRFGFPMLGDFELRGTSADIERLAEIIVNTQKKVKLIQGIMSLGCLTFFFYDYIIYFEEIRIIDNLVARLRNNNIVFHQR